MIDEKLEVKKQFFLSDFAKQGVARLLTFYFRTRDRVFFLFDSPEIGLDSVSF